MTSEVVLHYSFQDAARAQLLAEVSDRAELFEQGRDTFSTYRYKSFTIGLEGWLLNPTGGAEQHSLGPPPWEQVLAVVLGL